MSDAAQISRVGAGLRGAPRLGPFGWLESAWENRILIARLTKREIQARYRGSFLGLLWSLVVPVLLLAVYTFVFSVVFEARWDTGMTNRGFFALVLFSGLILFNLFAECVNRSPALMLQNVTYIKKVVFPLEVLPWVTLLAALFNAAVSFAVLAVGYFFVLGTPPWSVAYIPLMIIPLLFLTLGISLFLSSIGVFIRDLQHVISVLTMMLMFLTPIFFPLSAVPETFRSIIQWSPLSIAVEGVREALFRSHAPNLTLLAVFALVSWAVAWFGFAWFMKTKKGFADVV